MNGLHLRSSQSSYGDPRHFSAASFGVPQPPPTKVLLEGYRNAADPHNVGKSQYHPFNSTAHPRNSIPPSTNDPVAMYLLTETAMGDSANYDILSLEEVEGLKKDFRVLSSHMNAKKRKLALELKLRAAAMSLSRLHNRSSRTSEEYNGTSLNYQRTRRSVLERNAAAVDQTDAELASSNEQCEKLASEIWDLERKVQNIQRKLLEHTAGVLQLTHKGLKKNMKNGIPHTPESLSSNNTLDDFDDRSLYKPSEHFDFGGHGTQMIVGQDQMQNTERKLEYLSNRMRDMILQFNPSNEFDQIPQPSNSSGPVSPTTMVDAHLSYIENALGVLNSSGGGTPYTRNLDDETDRQLKEISTQLFQIVENPGLPRSQTLPPTPGPNSALSEQLAYLGSGINGLYDRVEKLLDQKSILTTQIQQQRELNSKSDAERDAHIADLIEQLAHVRKELEHSEQQGQQSRDDLELAMEQLEEMRQDLADHKSRGSRELLESENEAQARAHAEAEVSRLQNLIQELQHERDEHHETRIHAENEATRLESLLEQLRSEHETNQDELHSARSRAEGEVVRLQGLVDQLQEIAGSHENAEQQISQLEETIQQIRNDSDAQVKEANDLRAQAESEISRLQASVKQLRADMESQLKEASEAQTLAEDNSTRLQLELTELEGEVVRAQTELTMVKAELDGAYGTRAQRAAEAASNPVFQKELDELNTRNMEMALELATLKAGKPGNSDVQTRVETLEKELRETVDDYEAMTKASIEFEKERERFERVIDDLRDRCEQLETQLNEERISWMGIHNSTSSLGRDATYETTSTMVLKNEFKKMMRDTRAENMKILKAEHEERRRLEAIIRGFKKEQANLSRKSSLGQSATAS